MHAKSLQSSPTLCDPIDCSLPGSSVHGILQAGICQALLQNPVISQVSIVNSSVISEFSGVIDPNNSAIPGCMKYYSDYTDHIVSRARLY